MGELEALEAFACENWWIVERTEENDRFMNDMQTRFHYLRKRVAEEKEVRRERGHEMRQRAEERFSENKFEEMSSALFHQEPEVHKSLEEVRVRLAEELEMRSSSQESIVQEMMRIMRHFETSISESGKRQLKTKAHLQAMKRKLREEE
ncbi:unnamed protein product [Durusdinium trenchii]|uniref:Uncharacterized protein n=1 Tax=Durusdinium trenchii TaxID=1381693 RepID=A0ABP0J5A8_9DINO